MVNTYTSNVESDPDAHSDKSSGHESGASDGELMYAVLSL